MPSVTNEFKNALQENIKSVTGYVVLEDGTEYYGNESSPLQKFTITSTGGFLKAAMSKVSITLLGEHQLADQVIEVHYGVNRDGVWLYTQKGRFIITDVKYNKDKNTTELVGYDNMYLFMKPYQPVSDFPTTLASFIQSLAAGVGVPLNTETIYNGSLPMPEDYWATIPEATYRDVLTQICEVTVSNARIKPSGELELIPIDHQTGETLTYDNLLEYKLEDSWGDVNSLVLSRQPQNDDIFQRDEEAINAPTNRNILDLNKFNVGYIEGGA